MTDRGIGGPGRGRTGEGSRGSSGVRDRGQVGSKGLGQVGRKGPGQDKGRFLGENKRGLTGQSKRGVTGQNKRGSGTSVNGDRFPLTELGIRPPTPTPRAIIPRTECEPHARKGGFGDGRNRTFGIGRVQGNVTWIQRASL